MKKIFSFILVFLTAGILLTGCDNGNSQADNQTKKTLRVGVSPGPYNDLFNDAIKPVLEKEGYEIKLVSFSGLLESNIALTENSIDLNVAQHMAFMKVFNQQRNANLVSVVHVPSVPAGIFSDKLASIQDVKSGAIVAIPQDPSNAARAYNLLEKAGWIKLKPGIDPILANKNDVIDNVHSINIKEVDSANIPRMMADVDFAVIPGSIVYSAGLKAEKSLLSESIVPDLEIMVVVNQGNENSEWAQAVKRAYQSEQFHEYMKAHNQNNYWVLAGQAD